MMSLLAKLLKTILLLFLLGILLAIFIGTTDSGMQLGLKIAQKFLNNRLQVQQLEGRLSDEINLQHLVYEDAGLKLQIEKLALKWQPFHLLKKEWLVDYVKVAGIELTIKEPSKNAAEKSQSSTKPSLAIALALKNLDVRNLIIYGVTKKPIQIESMIGHVIVNNQVSVSLNSQLRSPITLKSELSAAGTADHYQWQVVLQGDRTHWVANGQGGKSKMTLTAANGQLLEGELSAMGYLSWHPLLNWQFSATAKSLNLDKVVAAAPKNLSFSAAGKGDLHHLALDIKQLTAVAKNLPLTAHLKLVADIKDEVFHTIADLMNNVHFETKFGLHWGNLYANLQGNLTEKWDFQYKLHVPQLKQFTPLLTGAINWQGDIKGEFLKPISNNSFLIQSLKSESIAIQRLQGGLLSKIQLAGTFEQPAVNASINLTSTDIKFSQPNLQLKGCDIRADIANTVASYKGSLFSAAGALQLQGTTSFAKNAENSFISITGKQFLLASPPQLKIYLSPNLTLENKAQAWYVRGTIAIPAAEINWANTSKTVSLPKETIIVKANGDVAKKNVTNTFTDMLILLGNKVHIKASGLDSFLIGKVHIKDQPGAETMANGRLEFKQGSYDLKGQKLNLQQSNLVFTNSPVDNPNLHIRADKIIHYTPSEKTFAQDQTFLVGVQVTGTAEDPHISLFADPAIWSPADILSLIVLGQPANSVSQGKVQLLVAAASALTPESDSGIDGMTQQVQRAFGLSKVAIESGISKEPGDNSQSTSFVLGKYLSPRLYLSYSLGVINSVNTLRLKYLLTKHWSLQTQTNILGSGGDILYSLEH
jgi:autotransporter translocation and assembly factor TamB